MYNSKIGTSGIHGHFAFGEREKSAANSQNAKRITHPPLRNERNIVVPNSKFGAKRMSRPYPLVTQI